MNIPDPNGPNPDPPYFFPGKGLPQQGGNNIVQFQATGLTGTYNPQLDTQFQLYFKAPLGIVGDTNLLVSAQVKYTGMVNGQATTYVETYPRVELTGIGGLVMLTNQNLGAFAGVVGPDGARPSGVGSATRTVGTGQVDPNLSFDVFQPNGG